MSAVNSLNQKALILAFENAFVDEDVFDDAIASAQKTFRTVLAAMANPGHIFSLSPVPTLPVWLKGSDATSCAQSQGRLAGFIALARALCDGDTALWLDESLRSPALCQYLRFHCAAPLLDSHCPGESNFAFIASPQNMPRLSVFQQNSLPQEKHNTTVLIACALEHTAAHSCQDTPSLPLAGTDNDQLPLWFWEDFQHNHHAYPTGVDCIFVDAHADGVYIMALPRSVRIKK